MKWKIGNVEISNRIVFAPMAGISNESFRCIIKEMGAGLIYSEMISNMGIIYNSKNTLDMLKINPEERPISIQIFGSDVDSFVKAAKYVEENIHPEGFCIRGDREHITITGNTCKAAGIADLYLNSSTGADIETVYVDGITAGQVNFGVHDTTVTKAADVVAFADPAKTGYASGSLRYVKGNETRYVGLESGAFVFFLCRKK